MEVTISVESRRECGFRKPSKDGVGIYLRSNGFNEACERLPWPLTVCQCCGQGFKPTRGFTWVNPMSLFDPYEEPCCTALREDDPFEKHNHERCWMCNPELLGSKAGMLWIGEKFYARPVNFMREAETMGISRKIAAIPNGFEVGTHAIFLAHRYCIPDREKKGEFIAGVFAAFKPSWVDIVIADENRVPDKAIEIAKRLGSDKARLVKVIPDHGESEAEGLWEDMEEA